MHWIKKIYNYCDYTYLVHTFFNKLGETLDRQSMLYVFSLYLQKWSFLHNEKAEHMLAVVTGTQYSNGP